MAVLVFVLTMSSMLVLEILWRRSDMRLIDRVRGLQVWLVMVPLWIVWVTTVPELLRMMGVQPLIKSEIALAGWFAVPLATLLAFAWTDFFFYWFHRAQHRFLWKFHSVHHSIENLSAVNSYHHWSEAIFWPFGVTLPMFLIDLDFAPQVFAVSFIFGLQPTFIHTDTRLNFGKLGWLFVDNRYHRIHHSLEERHFDRNFGAMTTLWDRLFGTHYELHEGEWPAVGVAGRREPLNLWQWALLPWAEAEVQPDAENAGR